MTSPDSLQRKSTKELHPSLALPLIANASLAFLKRHLALTAPQQALIDESLEANSLRLVAAERALDAAAESKVGLPNIAWWNLGHEGRCSVYSDFSSRSRMCCSEYPS